MWRTAAKHGLIVGVLLSLLAFVSWIGDLESSVWMRYANWIVIIASVYYAMKTWRDQFMDGLIRYGQAFKYGLVVMFLASVVYGFYNIIYINFLDPDYIMRSMTLLEESYEQMGFSEERTEMMLEMALTMQTPMFQAFSTIIGTTFLGLIISLIVAMFVRREGDPFQEAMKKVDQKDHKLNEE